MFGQKKAKGLNIIIVGCGRVGTTLVEQLSEEGHDVTVIDNKADVINKITGIYDVMGVIGNGASFNVQTDAGISGADLFIAVTESDELNILCCTVANQIASCATIARVRNPEYSFEANFLRGKLGMEFVINPGYEASKEMVRILLVPSALEVNSFAKGNAEMVKFRVPSGNVLDGLTVAEIGAQTKDVLICAVERAKQIFIPSGNFEIHAGDVVSFVAPQRFIRNFFKQIGFKTNHVKDTLIVGGGESAYYLARELLKANISVKIIEKDKARCEELNDLLAKAVIINGDATDEELLLEEGIQSVESFVPLTGSDEENIMLSLVANRIADTKVITKIDNLKFSETINDLGLGSIIYPRYITTEAIIAYVRAKSASRSNSIVSLSHMFEQRVEGIEFIVDEESKVTNIPLSNLKIKNEVLICFIHRKGKIIIPSGQDSIIPGDSVMIVTKHKGFVDILDILE